MAIILSQHAQLVLHAHAIPLPWVEATIHAPDRHEQDPADPTLTRSFRRIPQAGNRMLRVVHRPDGPDILIVTAFLDRGATP